MYRKVPQNITHLHVQFVPLFDYMFARPPALVLD